MYFPIDGSSSHGLLWVNHEYSSDVFVQGSKTNGAYSAKQIEEMLYVQGGSIIEVVGDKKGGWKMDTTSKYARRITGLTPFTLTGPAAGSATVGGKTTVQGTFANCQVVKHYGTLYFLLKKIMKKQLKMLAWILHTTDISLKWIHLI